MNIDKIEKRALIYTVLANLIMAIAGWVTYHFTGSQAILLDGNFSFVIALATIIAIRISKIKHKKTIMFPYGSYVYEPAFVLSKGLLTLGIIIVAFFQSAFEIIRFFQGETLNPVFIVPIYYYTVFVLVLTSGLLLFFNHQNKIIKNKSGLLLVETSLTKIDGVFTLAMGFTFFLISFIEMGSKFESLIYIGDSVIVLLLGVLIIGDPIKIIKNAFIELGGGAIQNPKEKLKIESEIDQVIIGKFLFDSYITKVGSGYLIVIYIKNDKNNYTLEEFRKIQNQIRERLKSDFPTISVEIALRD